MRTSCAEIIERMKRAGRLKNDSAVARRLGITPQAVSNYKKRDKMPLGLVLKFSQLYDLSVDWLLTGAPQKNMPPGLAMEDSLYGYGYDAPFAVGEGGAEAGLSALSAEEMICLGKFLKILRGSNKSVVDLLKSSVDAMLKKEREAEALLEKETEEGAA